MDLDPQRLLSSISDNTRLRVVCLLFSHGELCVCELVDALNTHQPKVSKHLGILRRQQIIVSRREGQWIHYRLNPELPSWAQNILEASLQGAAAQPTYQADNQRLLRARSTASCE